MSAEFREVGAPRFAASSACSWTRLMMASCFFMALSLGLIDVVRDGTVANLLHLVEFAAMDGPVDRASGNLVAGAHLAHVHLLPLVHEFADVRQRKGCVDGD